MFFHSAEMESRPGIPDSLSTLERDMIVRALRHLRRTDKTLSEHEGMMAKRLEFLIEPPESLPDLSEVKE